MKNIAYCIQSPDGRWFDKDKAGAGWFWTTSWSASNGLAATQLAQAWKAACQELNCKPEDVEIYVYKRGKVENISTLAIATHIWWTPKYGANNQMMRIAQVYANSKIRSITGQDPSYWALRLCGETLGPVRIWRGLEVDILVKFKPKYKWYHETISKSQQLRACLS